MTKPLVIWHGGCNDGFTSAWVVNRYYKGAADFFPGVYSEPPPDVAGRDVVMVDFSYKAPVIEEMRKTARSILILDHHKTAEADLRPYHPSAAKIRRTWPHFPGAGECVAFFDMSQSGASLSWDFYFADTPLPAMVRYVEDYDLWRLALPDTKALVALMYSHKQDFVLWDILADEIEEEKTRLPLIQQGEAILRTRAKDIAALIGHGTRDKIIGHLLMPTVNAPWFYASEIGNELAKTSECKASATYYDRDDGKRTYSLRSTDDGPDVSLIAASLGGGGHKHAAGFTVLIKEDIQ